MIGTLEHVSSNSLCTNPLEPADRTRNQFICAASLLLVVIINPQDHVDVIRHNNVGFHMDEWNLIDRTYLLINYFTHI